VPPKKPQEDVGRKGRTLYILEKKEGRLGWVPLTKVESGEGKRQRANSWLKNWSRDLEMVLGGYSNEVKILKGELKVTGRPDLATAREISKMM